MEKIDTSTWTASLLSASEHADSEARGWWHEARRLASGIALASVFGAALGLRQGGLAIASHAIGVSLGVLAVCAVAVPTFSIVLAMANASVQALGLARATSRAAASAGLVLAGLAPGAALFVATVEDSITVTLVGSGGLLLAGALAMRSFARELAPQFDRAEGRAPTLAKVALCGFLIFAATLAARIWWITLPIVRGGL